MKINGKWKINCVDVSQTRYVLFDFISNNQRFIGMDLSSLVFITHFDEVGTPYGVNFVDDDYNIVSEYSTISIIGEAEVDELLIVPFKMEKISDVDTIPMTHPKGIKLLTKGHKLSKDLEVVPTFDVTEVETVDITVFAIDGGEITLLVVEDGIVKSKVADINEKLKVVVDSFAYLVGNVFASPRYDYYDDEVEGGWVPISPTLVYTEGTSQMKTIYQVTRSGRMSLAF